MWTDELHGITVRGRNIDTPSTTKVDGNIMVIVAMAMLVRLVIDDDFDNI